MRRRAIVQAYLDESGERSHAPVLVLAGFIAPYTATEKRQIYNFPWKARRQIPGVQFITMKNPTEDSGGAYFEVRCLGCAMATWKERRAWRRELKDNGVGL